MTVVSGRTWQSNSEKADFTAVSSVVLPFRQRAASLFVEVVVEQSESGEELGGENRPAQIQE